MEITVSTEDAYLCPCDLLMMGLYTEEKVPLEDKLNKEIQFLKQEGN